MKLIESFSVDHTAIIPGIFTSRKDTVGGEAVTTYDIRLKRPNVEPPVDVAAMHSLEHIVATTLRNDPEWKDEIIYWGPMGCLTGFYLIMKGCRTPREIFGLTVKAFKSVEEAKEVPGATPTSCGNYRLHDLQKAKFYAAEFVSYLEDNADNPAVFEYPKTSRPVIDGKNFFDS